MLTQLAHVRESLRKATGPYILDVNEETITVAIPLQRRLIRTEHAFLHALSECAGPALPGVLIKHLDTRPIWTKIARRCIKPLYLLACSSFLAVTIGGAAYAAHHFMQGPVWERRSAAVRTPVVRHGDNLVIDFVSRQNHVCDGVAEHMFERTDGSVAWLRRRDAAMAGKFTLGEWTPWSLSIPILKLDPGSYRFVSRLTSTCSHVFNPEIVTFPSLGDPPLEFQVVD